MLLFVVPLTNNFRQLTTVEQMLIGYLSKVKQQLNTYVGFTDRPVLAMCFDSSFSQRIVGCLYIISV